MSLRTKYYPARYASRVVIDGTPILRSMVVQRLPSSGKILDVGAGSGSAIYPYDHPGVVLIGIDPSKGIAANPYLHSYEQTFAETMPFENSTFDLVFSDFAIEHLRDPPKVVGEICRVLKPGGWFVFRTVNKCHYVALASLILPESVRVTILRSLGRQDGDSFLTYYRMNTRRKITTTLRSAGLELEQLRMIEGPPDYLTEHCLLYQLGVAYERASNLTERLAFMRGNFLVAARRTSKT